MMNPSRSAAAKEIFVRTAVAMRLRPQAAIDILRRAWRVDLVHFQPADFAPECRADFLRTKAAVNGGVRDDQEVIRQFFRLVSRVRPRVTGRLAHAA